MPITAILDVLISCLCLILVQENKKSRGSKHSCFIYVYLFWMSCSGEVVLLHFSWKQTMIRRKNRATVGKLKVPLCVVHWTLPSQAAFYAAGFVSLRNGKKSGRACCSADSERLQHHQYAIQPEIDKIELEWHACWAHMSFATFSRPCRWKLYPCRSGEGMLIHSRLIFSENRIQCSLCIGLKLACGGWIDRYDDEE